MPSKIIPADKPESFRDTVYRIVKNIPKGKVATYGQVANLAGNPRGAQQVGYAMGALQDKDLRDLSQHKIPWHRVINRFGEISYSIARKGGDDLQHHMLVKEGVVFDKDGKVNMEIFQWEVKA